jgi:hypothetical protein
VLLGPADENGVGAEVSGSAEEPYAVLIDWSEAESSGELAVFCDCPRFSDGFFCKHLWATLRSADAAGANRHVPGTGALGLERDFDLAPDGWDLDTDGEVHPESAPTSPPEVDERSWRRQLEKISHTLRLAGERRPPTLGDQTAGRIELWLMVDVAATLRSGRLTIDLYQREETSSGGMGVIKQLALDEERAARLSDDADRDLATLVLALAEGSAGEGGGGSPRYASQRPPVRTVRVPAGLYDSLLPRFASEGRLGWWEGFRGRPDVEDRLAWDDGPPWRLALRLHAGTADGPARIEGLVARDGETVPLSAPLVMLKNGLVVFRGRIARLDVRGDFPWISWLREIGDLEIPGGEVSEVFRVLGSMAALPPLLLDDELHVASESPAPRPGLSIERPEAAGARALVRGELFFRYGDHRVPEGDPRSVLIDAADPADAVRLLRRDPEAEAEARGTVLDLGAVPEARGRSVFLPVEPPPAARQCRALRRAR